MPWYEFYCDESNTHGRPDFWLGGLRLTPARKERLRKTLIEYKENRQISFELKWTSVSTAYLSRYREFADFFLNDVSASFKALHINKGPHWRTFGRTEEERFFKSYYVFFRDFSDSKYRYKAFLDYKTSKWYRWQSLQFALNGAFRRDKNTRVSTFQTVCPIDSKTEPLLQLTDIILGALQYQGSPDSAKGQLAEHIRAHLKSRTRFGTYRIETRTFSPPMTFSKTRRLRTDLVLRERPACAVEVFEALTALPADFMAEGRSDTPPQEREGF